jgi:cytochrome c oxidase assembly protein subunit 15
MVVVLGAYVRLTAAGLGCPDWPGCYGHLTPAGAAQSADAASAFPGRPLEPGKAWREMIHRYAVGTLSVIVILVTALAISSRRERPASVPLALALFATLIMQALLGMLTVTWRLNPLIVTLHLLFGMTTLALLWWLLLSLPRGSRGAAAPPGADPAVSAGTAPTPALARRLTLLGLTVLAVQIALGGWTSSNYAAVACPDFPTCQDAWWPHGDFRNAFVPWRGLNFNYEGGVLDNSARIAIHLTHRLGAVLTTAALGLAALFVLRARPGESPLARMASAHPTAGRPIPWGPWWQRLAAARPRALLVLAALALQLTIGITMVLQGFPLWLATAHTAGAALLLLATLALLRALI